MHATLTRRTAWPHAVAVMAALMSGACGGSGGDGTGPAPTAQSLAIVSGDQQRARITRALPAPVVVVARTAQGAPAPGATITFSPSSGTVDPASATTDASGRASTRWTLGPSAGDQTLTARLASGSADVLSITATADPAIDVVVTALDGDRQQAIVGSPVLVPPTVRVTDRAGAPVRDVRVRFVPTAGSVVATAEGLTDGEGRATAGAWTMGGTPATAQVSVGLADGDVVTTAPLPSFTAVAVAAGGIATSPARDYVLQSTGPLTVTDSVAQLRVVFPQGANGTLTVSRIVGGPDAPFPGAMRAAIGFDGAEPLALEVAPTPTGEPAAYRFGTQAVTMEGPSGQHWMPLPQTLAGNVVHFVLNGPAAARAARAGTAEPSFAPPAPVAVGLLPTTPAARSLFADLQAEVQRTVDFWIAAVPNEALRDNMRERAAASPLEFSWGSCPCRYQAHLPNPHIHFCEELGAHTPSHEAGHFLTDLMLAGPRWTQIANLAPGMLFPGKEHDFGMAIGFRQTVTEEYAFLSSFLLYGYLPRFTQNYDPTSKPSSMPGGFELLEFEARPPSAADGPSREGFATVLLANLMRDGVDTLVRDFTGELSPSPALGFTPSDIIGILSHGPRNIMEVRDEILVALDDDESTLAALAEPIGWSYRGRGVVRAASGATLPGATVVPLITTRGREYRLPASAPTGSDGAFALERLFPGPQVLRVYLPRTGGGTDSIDVSATMPWDRSTATEATIPDVRLVNTTGLNAIMVGISGFTMTNALPNGNACFNSMGALNWFDGVFAPIVWNGNRFTVRGQQVLTSERNRTTYTIDLAGEIRQQSTDTIVMTVAGSASQRNEGRRFLENGIDWEWTTLWHRGITLSVRDAPLRVWSTDWSVQLTGTAAIERIQSAQMTAVDHDRGHNGEYAYDCRSTGVNPTEAALTITVQKR